MAIALGPGAAIASARAETVGAEGPVALRVRGLSKRFGEFVALDGVDLDVRAGEIHALLGENGAGKSTLCNLVFGAHAASAGEMRLAGRAYRPRSPRDAIDAGVAMVHQHFSLIRELTVADNLQLGHASVGLSRRACIDRFAGLCARYGFAIPATSRVERLTVGQMQQVEIAKALLREPRLLVLDEPTAVLDGDAIEALMRSLRSMAAQGIAVMLVTHKLAEIRQAADRVSVLRRGALVDSGTLVGRDVRSYVASMIGRDPDATQHTATDARTTPHAGGRDDGIMVDGLGVAQGARRIVDNITFLVAAGEAVGVAGVEGNGQSELAAVLCGHAPPTTGRVFVSGDETTRLGATGLRRLGIGLIPEDRHRDGCIAPLGVAHNLFLDDLARFSRFGFLDDKRLEAAARARMAAFDVRAAHPFDPLSSLSGGNQQKVVLARELSRANLRAVIAVQPTRGLDFGAVGFVYAQLLRACRAGAAVLVISSEIDELMAHCDRILVMFKGRIAGEMKRPFERERLGHMMAGMRT